MKKTDISSIVAKYVAVKFPDCPLPGLEHYVSALILPKSGRQASDSEETSPKRCSELSGIINETLYRFNKHRLNELLTH